MKNEPLAIETKGIGELILYLAEDGVRKFSGVLEVRPVTTVEIGLAAGLAMNFRMWVT